jgi:O-antigen ligase
VLLIPLSEDAPFMPFTTVSVFSHKPGNVAIAALLALGCMWLFRDRRSGRSRATWSMVALVVIGLAATQNRGGLLGVAAGAAIGLVFVKDRLRLVVHAVVILAIGLALAILLDLRVPYSGVQGRDFSASQLVDNIVSLGGADTSGNLEGTVDGREQLWTRILDKQLTDGRLLDGSGFGQNLASEVGVYDEGKDTLRSPHNSHLHIMARMGLAGLALWGALWLCWYWRVIKGCRHLAQQGMHTRRQVAILSLTVATAVLVSSIFDPQLEGPQIAALLWTIFGVGVAVTSRRTWFDHAPPTRRPDQGQ